MLGTGVSRGRDRRYTITRTSHPHSAATGTAGPRALARSTTRLEQRIAALPMECEAFC